MNFIYKPKMLFSLARLILISCIGATSFAAAPTLIFWNGERLQAARTAYTTGPGDFSKAIVTLLSVADSAVTARSPSVMDKTKLPISGDKHDYVSQATYWRPDATKLKTSP